MTYVTWLSLFRISSPQERGISSVVVYSEDDCSLPKAATGQVLYSPTLFHLIIVFQLSGTLHFLTAFKYNIPCASYSNIIKMNF